MRRLNHYFNARKDQRSEQNIVSGKMGERDRNTGRYRTQLNNQGVVPTKYIGRSNSQPQGYTTEIDLDGWADN